MLGRMTELSDRVVAFVSEGTRTGKLAFTASDGRPLVAPVWFVADGNDLIFDTVNAPHVANVRNSRSRRRVVDDTAHSPSSAAVSGPAAPEWRCPASGG